MPLFLIWIALLLSNLGVARVCFSFRVIFGNMEKVVLIVLVALCAVSCEKVCNEDLRVGESLRIPVDLSAYSESEIAAIYVQSVNAEDTTELSFRNHYLIQNMASGQNWIKETYSEGHYTSALDGSSLHFYFPLSDTTIQMLDSMTNIIVKKSQEKVDDPCYEDHPNIKIDELSFTHDGVVKGKGDVVVLGR